MWNYSISNVILTDMQLNGLVINSLGSGCWSATRWFTLSTSDTCIYVKSFCKNITPTSLMKPASSHRVGLPHCGSWNTENSFVRILGCRKDPRCLQAAGGCAEGQRELAICLILCMFECQNLWKKSTWNQTLHHLQWSAFCYWRKSRDKETTSNSACSLL